MSAKTYDFTLTASGAFVLPVVGSFFKILTTTGSVAVINENGEYSPLTVGQGANYKDVGKSFQRLTIKNLTAGAVVGTIFVGDDEFIDQSLILTGGIAVRPEDGIFWSSSATNTAAVQTIFTPASNINGAIVFDAQLNEYNALNPGTFMYVNLLAKTSAPANNLDGDLILINKLTAVAVGVFNMSSATLANSRKIAAGKGLYLLGLGNVTSLTAAVNYKLL